VGPDQPRWVRLVVRAASRRASDPELGDVVEEYVSARRSAAWLVSQIFSIVRRRRSHRTISARGAEMLANVRNDFRYALRTLARSPGFTAAAIAPIALGIGINSGVFSILNSVAWRSLPAHDADALVSIYQDFRGGPRRLVYGARTLFSLPEYRTYRDEAHTLSGLMAYSREWTATLGRASPEEVSGILVTCNYFDVLGLSPAIGRSFTSDDCVRSATPVVILSHALWQRAFGGDPQVLHRPIVLNGREIAVAGVAPPGFDGVDMAKAAFFAPTSMAAMFRPEQDLQENAHVSWLTLIGRRREDVPLAQTRADLSVVANRIDAQHPGRTTSLIVEPAAALSLPPARQTVLRGATIVLAAFGLVLLIAAANVANMLLARAAARTREIAVRVSVGATRARLIQQLFTESAIIAVAGAVGGSLLFWWFFEALLPVLLGSVPDAGRMRIDATPDGTVLWFAIGLTVATALAFGLVPALQASKSDVHALIKQSSADPTGGRGWLRGTLVGGQIALCTILLIPAGLLSRALYAAYTFDPGFDHHNVAMVSIALRDARYEKGHAAIFHEQWVERISALPGIARIAVAGRMPLSPGRTQSTVRLADNPEEHVVDVNTVSPDFFTVLDIPIVRGRVFTAGELDVALVTESTARRYWHGEDAIGRSITVGNERRRVVGIVRDAQISPARDAVSSYLYVPAARDSRNISALVRTRVGIEEAAAAIRAETAGMDRNLVVRVQPLSDNLAVLQTLSQIAATVASLLSLLALSLAAIGVYGVVTYVVSRRQREVGIRMALGATARDMRRLILAQTLRPVAVGMAVGIAAAAAAARVLQSVLFGVSPFDPAAYLGTPLVMMAVATFATWLPTRQTLRSDPVTRLRE
jgi:predicted permease